MPLLSEPILDYRFKDAVSGIDGLPYQLGIIGAYKVPYGDIGLQQKLRLMEIAGERGVRSPRLHLFVRRLLIDSGVPAKDQKGEVLCIYNYVKNHIRYTRDPYGIELFADPEYTLLVSESGDCDCTSILLYALLKSVGYRVRFKAIETMEANEFNHVYPQVEIPRGSGNWLNLDTTVSMPIGWEAPKSMVKRNIEYPLSGLAGIYDGFFNQPLMYG